MAATMMTCRLLRHPVMVFQGMALLDQDLSLVLDKLSRWTRDTAILLHQMDMDCVTATVMWRDWLHYNKHELCHIKDPAIEEPR